MRYLSMAVTLALLLAMPAAAQLDEKVADRFWESTKILEQTANAPDGGIPRDLLGRAECVAVIPAVKRAAFGFGGRYGRGVVVCRKDGGSGPWGAPSMISLGGGSFGLQLGGQSTDVLMLFMSPDSMKHLLADKLTLGADASAAVGPKGRTVSADTSATMRAEILTYARSRGLFAGISFEGAVLRPDKDANEALYGGKVNAEDLLLEGQMSVPEPAKRFIETLTKLAARDESPSTNP
ncbi:MAG: lipid-binding SYLF domain-containing protein [Pirellulaceae bacterium]|jgi:lipid-binding SYLF domain-containing protein|nr:lipid-binding SYLF domain-containing protein [Pirellulaceae bacterium]